MQKTLTIGGREVKFVCNASFPIVFKNQFGYDILTVIMPLISEVLEGLDSAMKAEEITPSVIGEVLENVYSLELTDIMHLIWTLAKLGNKDIEDCEKWFASFEEFEIFDVAKELSDIVLPSLISKKKLMNLKKMIKKQ